MHAILSFPHAFASSCVFLLWTFVAQNFCLPFQNHIPGMCRAGLNIQTLRTHCHRDAQQKWILSSFSILYKRNICKTIGFRLIWHVYAEWGAHWVFLWVANLVNGDIANCMHDKTCGTKKSLGSPYLLFLEFAAGRTFGQERWGISECGHSNNSVKGSVLCGSDTARNSCACDRPTLFPRETLMLTSF